MLQKQKGMIHWFSCLLAILKGLCFGNASPIAAAEEAAARILQGPPREDALLYREPPIPKEFLTLRNGHAFGGDVRIGDLDGDGEDSMLTPSR